MKTNEIVKINDKLIEAWNLHSAKNLIALCSTDIVYKINSGLTTFKGRKEVKEYFNGWVAAFPDLEYKVCDCVAAEDALAVEYEFSGTHAGNLTIWPDLRQLAPTHWKVTTFGAYILKLKNGKISAITKYPDRFSLFDQLGLLKDIYHLSF